MFETEMTKTIRPKQGQLFEGDAMKKMGELMKDLGFNPEASDSAKEAFLKYLIKNGAGVDVPTPTEKKMISQSAGKVIQFPQQLTFDFDEKEFTKITQTKSAHKA